MRAAEQVESAGGQPWPRRAQHTRRGASSGWPVAGPLPPACWPLLCKVWGPDLAVEILGWALGPSPDLSLCSRHGATQSGLGRAPLPHAQRPLHRAYPPRSPGERGQREGPKAVSEPTLRARRTLGSPGFSRVGLGAAKGVRPPGRVGEGQRGPGTLRRLSGEGSCWGRGGGAFPRDTGPRVASPQPSGTQPRSGGLWGRPQARHTRGHFDLQMRTLLQSHLILELHPGVGFELVGAEWPTPG